MFTKNEILEEIKRTTKENNDKPLGQKAFQKETGIGPYEWGRHWARFGDVLQEAGFKPNKPWTRVSDKILVKKMIEKIRKSGKYPTINEMRIEVDQDPSFPYHVIKKRKQEYIVKKIMEFCNKKNHYKDIVKICYPVIEKFSKKLEESTNNTGKNGMIGEVYLYKSGRNYKIGKTNDTVRRGAELKILLPEKVDLIHSIKTDDPSGVESYWHKRFEKKRGNGEWFKLNREDIVVFKKWKKIY